jgi:signal transduction histidine kinase
VLIGIIDTGEGIPPDKLEVLFDRFRQVDDNLVRRQMGTGLGLAISKELIEMHDGSIWVESEQGKGADFRFVLPY